MNICLFNTLGGGSYGSVHAVVLKTDKPTPLASKVWAGKFIKKSRMGTYTFHQVIMAEMSIPDSKFLPCIAGAWDSGEGVMIVADRFECNANAWLKTYRTTQDIMTMLIPVVLGTMALHDRGIAHRDIKLDNILIRNDLGTLCDFGMATQVYAPLVKDDNVCTYTTRAPEIWANQPHGTKADIWSLGAVLYETLEDTFLVPSRENPLNDLETIVSTAFRGAKQTLQTYMFLKKACVIDPSKRASIQDLLTIFKDPRRRLIGRKRPVAAKPLQLGPHKSTPFYTQRILSGDTFIGRPPPSNLVLVNAGRMEDLTTIRRVLSSKLDVVSFPRLVATIDIFDRLTCKNWEMRICLALYISMLAFDDNVTCKEVVDAFQPHRELDLLHFVKSSWWSAMSTLQWTMRTPETCTCTLLGGATYDLKRLVIQEYTVWPDGRSRAEMIKDASMKMDLGCWCDDDILRA